MIRICIKCRLEFDTDKEGSWLTCGACDEDSCKESLQECIQRFDSYIPLITDQDLRQDFIRLKAQAMAELQEMD